MSDQKIHGVGGGGAYRPAPKMGKAPEYKLVQEERREGNKRIITFRPKDEPKQAKAEPKHAKAKTIGKLPALPTLEKLAANADTYTSPVFVQEEPKDQVVLSAARKEERKWTFVPDKGVGDPSLLESERKLKDTDPMDLSKVPAESHDPWTIATLGYDNPVEFPVVKGASTSKVKKDHTPKIEEPVQEPVRVAAAPKNVATPDELTGVFYKELLLIGADNQDKYAGQKISYDPATDEVLVGQRPLYDIIAEAPPYQQKYLKHAELAVRARVEKKRMLDPEYRAKMAKKDPKTREKIEGTVKAQFPEDVKLEAINYNVVVGKDKRVIVTDLSVTINGVTYSGNELDNLLAAQRALSKLKL